LAGYRIEQYTMTKFRRKYLTRRTITTIKSYSALYTEIVLLVRQDWLWFIATLLFIYTAGYEIYYLVILPESFTFPTIIGIVGSLSSLVLVMLIFFLAYSATQNPSNSVPGIIADMLIFYPRPYQDGLGLDYDDIQQLKRIAEIQQNSADWRSSYVNFGIVTIVAALIANPQLIWNFFIFPLYNTLYQTDSLPAELSRYLPQQSFTERLIAVTFVIILVLWLLYKWLTYFREFISSEYANRAILLACEELLAVYRIKDLPQSKKMLFHERRALLEQYGYHLVPDEKAKISDKNWTLLDLGENGFWYSIPPKKRLGKTRFGTIFTRLKDKIMNRANLK